MTYVLWKLQSTEPFRSMECFYFTVVFGCHDCDVKWSDSAQAMFLTSSYIKILGVVSMCCGRFSCPVMGAPARVTGFPRLLPGKTTRKGSPGGREGNRGPLTFSTQYRPSINVLLRTRDLRWNWLGHILRMEERQTVRQVLLNCVKPTQESILGDLNGKDVNNSN